MATSWEEKRRFPRAGARFILEYKVCEPFEMVKLAGAERNSAIMTDLSEGGTSFITEYNLVKGTVLEIKFTLINRDVVSESKHEKIIVRGAVRNAVMIGKDEYRIGVEFSNIDEKKKEIINSFVKNKGR